MSHDLSKNDIISTMKKFVDSEEFRCNLCGVIFKGDHECDYVYIQNTNSKLIRLIERYGLKLNETDRNHLAEDFKEIMNTDLY